MKLNNGIPGDRIRELRIDQGYTMKGLGNKCIPPIDFSTVGRIEKNKGYTGDSLNRLAIALGCAVSDFFMSDFPKKYTLLPDDLKQEVIKFINFMAVVAEHRQIKTSDEKNSKVS